ncbi:MAG: type II 3-dehydroquinate dehydratase [Sulfurimonas sp.]|jgi:3-dehydroquinate dehydratase-2|nr:type II 3-dehydroquinate dehydratase [Sulfurimonadaceae bacterium]
MKIVVIQGPNLNMLGVREQQVYGSMKLEQIHEQMRDFATKSGVEIEFFQSNFEGELVDKIQECYGDADGIIINAAAYTHTSIAIRDALAAVALPTVEVHISNVHRREDFRKENMIAPVCTSSVVGFGPYGYHLAIVGMLQIFNEINAIKEMQKQQQQEQ